MIGTKKLIVLCTSRIYDQQVHRFIEAFHREIRKDEICLLVFSIGMDIYWEEGSISADAEVFGFIPYEETDLLIIMDEKIKSHTISEDLIRKAHEKDTPVLVLDGKYPGTGNVSFDFRKGFEAVTRHMLLEHDVKHPHFIAGIQGNVFSEERLSVFKDILAEKGIPFEDSMVSYGEFWATPARNATKRLLERETLPDAILCANDIMAINVCDVLKNAGIKVPEQVIVSGFDGFDEAFLATPGITTASCDPSEMACATAELIRSSFESGEELTGDYLVEPRLILNESSGSPRFHDLMHASLSRFNDGFYRYQDDIRLMHNSITTVMGARSPKDASKLLRGEYTDCAFCVVDRKCFETDPYFFQNEDTGKDYVILHDPVRGDGDLVPYSFQDVMPRLEKKLRDGYPILVQSLDYMNKSMGFICYFFETYDITEYGKTASITEMVSMGLGGFINMQYQQFLTQKMEEMYRFDALTGLYNRLAFREAFEEMKKDPANMGKPLLVVMADLDRLKKINDGLGHNAGDAAIAAVAHAVKSACPKEALCVRFGGDEMLAFVPGDADAEKIRAGIDAYLEEASEKNGFRISASCGFHNAVIDQNADAEKLMEEADTDMYIIKRERRP